MYPSILLIGKKLDNISPYKASIFAVLPTRADWKLHHTNTDGSDFKISKHMLKKMHFLFTTTQQVLLGSEFTLILQTPQVNLATLTTHYCCDWIERQFFNSHSKTFWIMTTKQKSAVLRTPLRKILEMISNQIHP